MPGQRRTNRRDCRGRSEGTCHEGSSLHVAALIAVILIRLLGRALLRGSTLVRVGLVVLSPVCAVLMAIGALDQGWDAVRYLSLSSFVAAAISGKAYIDSETKGVIVIRWPLEAEDISGLDRPHSTTSCSAKAEHPRLPCATKARRGWHAGGRPALACHDGS